MLSNEEVPIMHKIIVYNQEDFEEHIKNGLLDTDAYIEIYSGPNGKPIFSSEKQNIILLDFEDYPEDVRFPNSVYQPTNPTITHTDAERLVKFIKFNVEKERNFVIHCGAGVSRSQQVAAYILMTTWKYKYDNERSTHNHHFSQTIVLTRLLIAHHKLFPGFHNIDDEFEYDSLQDKWVSKYKK